MSSGVGIVSVAEVSTRCDVFTEGDDKAGGADGEVSEPRWTVLIPSQPSERQGSTGQY